MGTTPRRILLTLLTLLTLFLLGTVIVLSTVVHYFGVHSRDVITQGDMDRYERMSRTADAEARRVVEIEITGVEGEGDGDGESEGVDWEVLVPQETEEVTTPRIPKIIHQTWKTEDVPEKWSKVREECMEMHPDYEYLLWTDISSRSFIATHYPSFLPTFDSYRYPIQRADAIRYFVLHHFGGVYMDLDVGCRASLTPLLFVQGGVVLPRTIPVGVSNDVMLSSPRHPFFGMVVEELPKSAFPWWRRFGTNYPTVMFSTGPMFLSRVYSKWTTRITEARREGLGQEDQVMVLPRKWYGKNATPEERETTAIFSHFYGSSWHECVFVFNFSLLFLSNPFRFPPYSLSLS
ncbi:hypothetical protein T439DRAFT_328822 [Meredithblackwellia eburnea MCA 4105]